MFKLGGKGGIGSGKTKSLVTGLLNSLDIGILSSGKKSADDVIGGRVTTGCTGSRGEAGFGKIGLRPPLPRPRVSESIDEDDFERLSSRRGCFVLLVDRFIFGKSKVNLFASKEAWL